MKKGQVVTRKVAGQRRTRREAGTPAARKTLKENVKVILSGVVTLAGAITAIAAALYIVAPQLQPREKLGADVDSVGITQDMTYHEYVRTTRGTADGEEFTPGIGVTVQVSLAGYEERSYSMQVMAYDAKTLAPIKPAKGVEISATCQNKSPRAKEDGVVWQCWHVAPPAGRKYFVRASVFDSGPREAVREGEVLPGDRELLDWLDSPSVVSLASSE